MTETKAVYIGPNKGRVGEIGRVNPHGAKKGYVRICRPGRSVYYPAPETHYRILPDVTDLPQPSPYVVAGCSTARLSARRPDPHIEPDTWPWALAGIGVSDMPPTPVPTEPARKVHRMGRLFDDAPKRTPVNHGPAPTSMMRVLDGEQWDAAVLVRGEGE
jgi:hypothetical protein